MQNNILKNGMRMAIACLLLALLSQSVAAEGDAPDNAQTVEAFGKIGAGIALGLCGVGAGYSQAQLGAASVGYMAEGGNFGQALLFTVLPETMLILGLLPLLMG